MILKTRYPNRETIQEIMISSSTVGLLLYIFLIIYQPFGTSQFEHSYKYVVLLPYAAITAASFFCVNFLLRKQKRKWTVGLELFKTFVTLLFISSLSYLYNTLFLSKVALSFENYLYMFAYTSALGVPVAIIYILARYIYLNSKKKPFVNTMIANHSGLISPDGCVKNSDPAVKLCIVADNAHVRLEIKEEDFIYAESADNYCILHFYDNGILKQEMIRISLTKLLDQIQTDVIKKVHRSFILNLKMVSKFKGNASGYKISIKNIEKELSISRNYIDLVLPILKTFVVRP